MTTGERLRQAIKEKGWTPTMAAYYLGTCTTRLYEYEAGRSVPGTRRIALAIQKHLGIPAEAWDEPEPTSRQQ